MALKHGPQAAYQGRHPILDALRIILAFWVTMGHFGVFPLFAGIDSTTRLGSTLVRGWSSFVFGVPAVIGFFVISGFCIHLPFRHDERLPVGRYYARRYLRILVPVFAAILISRLAGNRQSIFGANSILWHSVLWSLACEEIYYAVYPLTRSLRRRWGWAVILPATFVVAGVTAAAYPGALDGSARGVLETAVILFPVWLLGCVLAEESDRIQPIDSPRVIWKWRFLVWAGSWACEMLHFKAHISLTQLMLCFGVLAYFWIRKEIAYGKRCKPAAVLVSAGLWSYSLYLMHGPAMTIFKKLPVPGMGPVLDWCVSYTFILGVSYLFYLAIEQPSHRMARSILLIKSPPLQRTTPVTHAAPAPQGSGPAHP